MGRGRHSAAAVPVKVPAGCLGPLRHLVPDGSPAVVTDTGCREAGRVLEKALFFW